MEFIKRITPVFTCITLLSENKAFYIYIKPMSTDSNFKAIIVGGGLSGLLTAVSLRSAGLDFILLEQRNHIVVNEGASIAVNPASSRILHQLGLTEPCREVGHPLSRKCTFFLDGYVWDSALFQVMEER